MAQVGLTTSRAENYGTPNLRTTIQRSRDLAAVLRATGTADSLDLTDERIHLAIAPGLEGGVDSIHQLPVAADATGRLAGFLGGRYKPYARPSAAAATP